jgi:hypothetical protein
MSCPHQTCSGSCEKCEAAEPEVVARSASALTVDWRHQYGTITTEFHCIGPGASIVKVTLPGRHTPADAIVAMRFAIKEAEAMLLAWEKADG